jgi:hypothetical protein
LKCVGEGRREQGEGRRGAVLAASLGVWEGQFRVGGGGVGATLTYGRVSVGACKGPGGFRVIRDFADTVALRLRWCGRFASG